MLTSLRIKNLALVEDLTLELCSGYNVITGETGAGKSIIIGALKLVLGERADRTLLRAGSDSCTVEAVFDIHDLDAPLPRFLEEHGLEPCEDHQLHVKRVFTAAGSNRQFINGTATTLGTLVSIGDWLVDMHGPHDHQSLLNTARQLDILDTYGDLAEKRDAFDALAWQHSELLSQKAELIVDEKTYAQQLDLLRFQTQEIKAAQLQVGEDERIEEEHQRAGNAARLLELGHAAADQMVESEGSLLTQAEQITRTLQELSRLDASCTPLLQQHEQAIESFHEIASGISRYLDTVEVDPAQLQDLEERLNLIQSLKRKYGSTLTEVIEFGKQAQTKLQSLEQRDEELERLNLELAKLEHNLIKVGGQLSDKRRKVIPKLCKEVGCQLQALGFKASHLDVAMETSVPPSGPDFDAPRRSGFDSVEFLFAPNPGEPARALRAIASSGELARVMLALKTVLAGDDKIPVLVFDEVDANVGGETAHTVGAKMKQVAARRQVFCITHLPQVAAPATTHYVVTKEIEGGRTLSRIKPVSGDERVQELARMLGGGSKEATQHANAMLTGSTS